MNRYTITIEDDDGFTTEMEWPTERLLLAEPTAIAFAEAIHEAKRALFFAERSET